MQNLRKKIFDQNFFLVFWTYFVIILVLDPSKCMQRSLQQVLEALNFTKSGVLRVLNELFAGWTPNFEAPEKNQNPLVSSKIKTRGNYVMSKLTFIIFSHRFAGAAEVSYVPKDFNCSNSTLKRCVFSVIFNKNEKIFFQKKVFFRNFFFENRHTYLSFSKRHAAPFGYVWLTF